MTTSQSATSKATIVVSPRDRFSLAVQCLNAIIEHAEKPYELIYVDAGSPKEVATELEAICQQNGFRYLRFDRYMAPCESRNVGYKEANTEYVVYVENDVMVTDGWLENLVKCADETGVEVVVPLTCQGAPLHTEIHQAGGYFAEDMDAFFNGPKEKRRLLDNHLEHQGLTVNDVELHRTETQVTELHSFLVRREAFSWLGPFDEGMPCSKDHIDFSLTVWSKGGRIMFEPSSVVTFCFPSRQFPVTPMDREFFMLRWSEKWQLQSIFHLRKKWGLEEDPYFDRYSKLSNWRYREAVAKPIVRKIPFIGHSYRVQQLGSAILLPFVDMWGAHIVRKHDAASRVRKRQHKNTNQLAA